MYLGSSPPKFDIKMVAVMLRQSIFKTIHMIYEVTKKRILSFLALSFDHLVELQQPFWVIHEQ
ncbi:unnamed protein product [Clonostachys rosea]|uniref:Uncharacterized protein n=1 Tax=Bionectria ochroleuca TaxID=29856 RepID=A0ABY6UER7_BIOOC|nr:unnamed protein product [Clonostachys rosea]